MIAFLEMQGDDFDDIEIGDIDLGIKCKSSCGIKSVNEYQDKLVKPSNRSTKRSHAETQDGRARAGAQASDHGTGVVSAGAYAGAAAVKDGNWEALSARSSADAQFGLGGAIAEAGADARYLNYRDDSGSVDVLKGKVGGGLGAGAGGVKAKVSAGVDLVEAKAKLGKNQAVSANLGLNVDTGAEVGVDGVGVSVAGFGFSAGRNTGIKTPFGGFSFKLW